MSPATIVEPALGLAFLAAAEARAQRVALLVGARPGGGLGLGPIRESAGDVPALIVCQECSRPFATALWPCLTMQTLDGMPEP